MSLVLFVLFSLSLFALFLQEYVSGLQMKYNKLLVINPPKHTHTHTHTHTHMHTFTLQAFSCMSTFCVFSYIINWFLRAITFENLLVV